MKGHNTITMNEATVKAAVQMYLDAQFKEGSAPTVMSIKPVASRQNGYSSSNMFEVEVSDKGEPTAATSVG